MQMDRSKLIEELISENMRFKEALEHICEVEMDSAEFDRELMFNIARDALTFTKIKPLRSKE